MNPQSQNVGNRSKAGRSEANPAQTKPAPAAAAPAPKAPVAAKATPADAKAAPAAASKPGSTAAPAPAPASAPVHQASETIRETIFKLEAAHAHEVLLAGSFTDWKKSAVKMVKGGGGVWHAKVRLKPGRHLYRFIVDGNWQDDPSHHAHRVPNPYGTYDTVLEVA